MPERGHYMSLNILLADDSEDDAALLRESLRMSGLDDVLHTIHNGEQVIRYLERKGAYVNAHQYPFPEYLLLDLNLPVMHAFEVIKAIRAPGGDQPGDGRIYVFGRNDEWTSPVGFAIQGKIYPLDRHRRVLVGDLIWVDRPIHGRGVARHETIDQAIGLQAVRCCLRHDAHVNDVCARRESDSAAAESVRRGQ